MTPSGATVLVVDDEPILRTIMCEWLVLEGYRVLVAEHGANALSVMETNRVDGILTDIRMPVMDGLTLLKRLNGTGNHVRPVIILSGFTDTAPREAYGLGAEAVISKPFRYDQLLSAVRRMFTSRAELWTLPVAVPAAQAVEASFPTLLAARQSGQLAFGRGGFCLQSAAHVKEGPVRFNLSLTDEAIEVTGQGIVRWTDYTEAQIGVEITSLEPGCLISARDLTAGSDTRCFIPRSSASQQT